MGLDLRVEESTAHGRSDVVLHGGQVFVVDCKMAGKDEPIETAVGRAMSQIRGRGYAGKYLADRKPVHLVALVFGQAECNLLAVHAERCR